MTNPSNDPSLFLGLHLASVRPLSGCSENLRSGIALLWQAWQYARDVQRDTWEFAVEIANLRQIGLTEADFRWLVCKELVQHADEITLLGGKGRTFRPLGELCFTERTCFVLTLNGAALAESICAVDSSADTAPAPCHGPNGSAMDERPYWDADRHELRLDGHVVKRFKHRSPNQEAILTAFQEEGWPVRVDDPLPPTTDCEPKRRLNDTIKGLNHHQDHALLRFRGDGTGEAVLWERVNGAQ